MHEAKTITIHNGGAYQTARAWANKIEAEFGIKVDAVWTKKETREHGYTGEAMVVFEGVVQGGDSPIASIADASMWRHLDSPRYWTENATSYAVAFYKK